MRALLTIVCLFCLTGCYTSGNINKNYENISYSDGISSNEAKDIALKKLLDAGVKHLYEPPGHIRKSSQYPNVWIVDYYPLMGMTRYAYVVVIDKNSGKVLHANQHSFNETNNWNQFLSTYL